MTFQDYIKKIRSLGQYSFTSDQALRDLNISRNALNSRVYKLKKKGEIISPAKNFYIIVPPEYREMGCLPAEEIIPLLMNYLDLNYYVALLSAAHYHGASHQKAQIFQVITASRLK